MSTSFTKLAWINVSKDLRLEWRSRDSINGMLFFALLVVILLVVPLSKLPRIRITPRSLASAAAPNKLNGLPEKKMLGAPADVGPLYDDAVAALRVGAAKLLAPVSGGSMRQISVCRALEGLAAQGEPEINSAPQSRQRDSRYHDRPLSSRFIGLRRKSQVCARRENPDVAGTLSGHPEGRPVRPRREP